MALKLYATEYIHGTETEYWTADRSDFRYKKAGGPEERCNFSLTGKKLVLSDCRLAGQYSRVCHDVPAMRSGQDGLDDLLR